MKTNALVSILIPTYNRPDKIGRAIESALGQSHENIEIVVTDNSPGNETRDLIESRFRGNSKIAYARNPENLGPQGNMRKAITISSGEYCVILPDDDWFCNMFYIEDALKRMERDGTDFVVAACLLNHGEDNIRAVTNRAAKVRGVDFYRGIWEKYWMPGISCLFKKSLLDGMEYCNDDKIHYCDHEMFLKICALTDVSCYNVPSQSYNFHQGNDLYVSAEEKILENAKFLKLVHEFWKKKNPVVTDRDYRNFIIKYFLITFSIHNLPLGYIPNVLKLLSVGRIDSARIVPAVLFRMGRRRMRMLLSRARWMFAKK